MKLKILVVLFTLTFRANANVDNQCAIEPYFERTEEYHNLLIENERLLLDKNINDLSLLPDIYIGTGQQSSNSQSFKSFDKSGLHAGISQTLYEGNQYGKKKESIDIELNNNSLSLLDKKNTYIINLYRAVIDYKYKVDLRGLYQSQLDMHRAHVKASKVKFESGNLSALEYEIVVQRENEISNNLNRIKSEIHQAELDILAEYFIPANFIEHINYKMIVSCKKESKNSLLIKNRTLELEKEKINYEIDIATLQPSVSISLNVSPPGSGTWNDLSINKAEFGLSVNASVPLSRFLSVNSINKKHSLSVKKINHSYDENQKLLLREKERVQSKISEFERGIQLLKNKLKLGEKEVDYMLTRFEQKKESIISYYRQLDEFEMEKVNLKKEERENEYYKAYLSILD